MPSGGICGEGLSRGDWPVSWIAWGRSALNVSGHHLITWEPGENIKGRESVFPLSPGAGMLFFYLPSDIRTSDSPAFGLQDLHQWTSRLSGLCPPTASHTISFPGPEAFRFKPNREPGLQTADGLLWDISGSIILGTNSSN